MKRGAIAWNPDIDWLLQASESALGFRGTLASCQAQLELGGRPTGLPNTDLYGDQVLGWGNHLEGSVERHRRAMAIWRRVPEPHQQILIAYYGTPQAPTDKDSGADPDAVRRQFRERGLPPELWGQFGLLAGVAYLKTAEPKRAALIRACEHDYKLESSRAITLARQRAETAVRAAHAAWDALETEDAEAWVEAG